jgi:hypothetical protein
VALFILKENAVMAVENSLQTHTLCTAAANYYNPSSALDGPNGSGQYLLVTLTGSGNAPTATLVAGNTTVVHGVLQNDPASGAVCQIAYSGVSKVVAGASITLGANLMSDTAGRAITATSAGTNPVCGYAMNQATAANQVISMMVVPQAIG